MPDYRNHAKGNLRFKLKEGNTEIVVATHGGYTPRRHRFNMFGIRKFAVHTAGSGTAVIPGCIGRVRAYSDHDKPSAGNFAKLAYRSEACARARAASMLAGMSEEEVAMFEAANQYVAPPVAETWDSGETIINYSLTHNSNCDLFPEEFGYRDLVRVASTGGKAHLKDVFDEIERLGLHYAVLHYGACRVNKATYETTFS